MKKTTFTAEALTETLYELGRLAHAAGRVVDLAIYGGSCLMLVSSFGFLHAADKGLAMMRPDTLAEVARRVSAGVAFGPARSEFLDEFYLHPARRQAMLDPPPPRLVDARQHAALGAVGEHLARRWGLVVPRWTDDPSRFPHEPYFTTPIEKLKALLLVESPLAFRRRLIFTKAEPLRRARMPQPRRCSDREGA